MINTNIIVLLEDTHTWLLHAWRSAHHHLMQKSARWMLTKNYNP
jgi:hypothetical protein